MNLDVVSVNDLNGVMELHWYENIGLCGEGAASMSGRILVCTDSGCPYSGEYIPTQALSQTLEIVT